MRVAGLYAAKSELFEDRRRIEAQPVANLFQGMAAGVVLHGIIDLRVTHTSWPLAYPGSFKMLAHRDSVDFELLGYLVDSHPI